MPAMSDRTLARKLTSLPVAAITGGVSGKERSARISVQRRVRHRDLYRQSLIIKTPVWTAGVQLSAGMFIGEHRAVCHLELIFFAICVWAKSSCLKTE